MDVLSLKALESLCRKSINDMCFTDNVKLCIAYFEIRLVMICHLDSSCNNYNHSKELNTNLNSDLDFHIFCSINLAYWVNFIAFTNNILPGWFADEDYMYIKYYNGTITAGCKIKKETCIVFSKRATTHNYGPEPLKFHKCRGKINMGGSLSQYIKVFLRSFK